MAFKNLHPSYKMMLGLRKYVCGGRSKRRMSSMRKEKEESLMMMAAAANTHHHVSHGCHVIIDGHDDDDDDKVVAEREEIEEHELWFFGVFDSRIGDGVNKYMQTHLFDKNKKIKKTHMRSRSKETMLRAHLNARAKVREADIGESCEMGSASAVIIDGEKMVIADMGQYQVVVCRDGKAYQINGKRLQQQQQQKSHKWHWSRKLIPGAFRKVKLRFKGRDYGKKRAAKTGKTSEVAVGYERVNSNTEFVILASIGIWEVMKDQEAVNLIRHIENPQEAAQCLAKEALIRMTKKNISCLIIRFY